MICENCSQDMNFLYNVIERETCFKLWECECSHKILERRPASPAELAAEPAPVAAAS